jgi:DNA ligase (NAD+)
MNETEKKEVALLRSQIHLHDHLYYVKDSPEISDRDYDSLYHRLKELEGKYPECATSAK